MGQPTTALSAIQAEIRSATPEQLRVIEAKLLGLLQTPEATPHAKSWACRTLRFAGSEQCVPALAAVLGDKQLSADALFALRSLAGERVDAALRAALASTQGLLKAGVIQTLGARGDRAAVALIAPLAGAGDPVVAEAALYALGQIGGGAALKALQNAAVPEKLKRYHDHALLVCCESLAAEGQAGEAAAVYRALLSQSADWIIQCGALRGLVRTQPTTASPELLTALSAEDPRLRAAAAQLLGDASDTELVKTALAQFSTWFPDTQAKVLGLLTQPAALPQIHAVLRDGNDEVRRAALEALGRLGGIEDVPALLAEATRPGTAQTAARKSLQILRGSQVNDALVAAAKTGAAETRCEAIRGLVPRNDLSALPVLLELAADADPTVRGAALKAVGQLTAEKDFPALVSLLVRSQTAGDRDAAENALTVLAQRVTGKEAAAASILAAAAGAPVATRCALLRLLVQVPCARSLEGLRAAGQDPEASVKESVLRTLADWPDGSPAPDLLALARSTTTPAHRSLALRGFIHLATLPGAGSPEQTVKGLAEAMTLSPAVGNKKAALAALAEMGHRSALNLAADCLADPNIVIEAATTVVRLAKKLQATDAASARAAVQRILDTCKSPAARQMAETAGIILGDMVNIAPQGTASSPDGLEKDGTAGDDQAAIDGNPDTYWDETDGAKLYRLVVKFKQPEKISALSLSGYAQHNFAPKDFQVICDGKVIKQVANATYTDNFLVVPLPETTCQSVELSITGYYGGSPAIRELGIYRKN